MCSVKRIGNLDSQRQQQFGFERTPCDAVLQGHAIEELHRDERMAIVLADFVNRADVGMVQGRGCLRFPVKAFQGAGVFSQLLRKKL